MTKDITAEVIKNMGMPDKRKPTGLVYSVAATGHRPNKINPNGEWDNPHVHTRLIEMFKVWLRRKLDSLPTGTTLRVISGMALGVDIAYAQAALALRNEGLNITLCLAIPFWSQPNVWKRSPHMQNIWETLRLQADEVEIISPDPKSKREAAAYLAKRNQWMIDQFDEMVALWNGTSGGTGNCIAAARKSGKKITNLWDSWVKYSGVYDMPEPEPIPVDYLIMEPTSSGSFYDY